MNPQPTLQEGLRKLQAALGLKGYELAAELRVTPEWLSMIKKGKRPISADLQIRALELLNRRGLNPDSIPELATAPNDGSYAVEEEAAVSNTGRPSPAIVMADIRRRVEEAITAANGDLLRLGYLREQVESNLRPPAHWTVKPDSGAQARVKREMAEIRRQGQNPDEDLYRVSEETG